ncbi:ferritin [Luteitalea sp. TBR-22]|uniref:ferritin n=1 Tax=Luteitalea sp. TBR-22 TaxID=2802971 RepID=UPI001AF37EB0|nr:ferritin [Luteitalea sp. TBR-22]BCS32877.1 ferritin [Luteitalea sp. TBR-22]
MSSRVYEAINDQVNNELSASHSYLAMSGVCEQLNFPGAAHWFRVQSEEERGHALRLFDFIHARNYGVTLRQIHVETVPVRTLLEVFRASLAQEEQVSKQIDALYEIAMQEKDFAAVVEMQWFVTEQVEEEKSARDVIAKLEMAGSDARALLEIDRELGARAGEGGGTGGEGARG